MQLLVPTTGDFDDGWVHERVGRSAYVRPPAPLNQLALGRHAAPGQVSGVTAKLSNRKQEIKS
jgi:hypothetical protein